MSSLLYFDKVSLTDMIKCRDAIASKNDYLTHLWPHQASPHPAWKQTFSEEALELGCCCSFDSGSPYCLIPLKDNIIIRISTMTSKRCGSNR